MQNLKLVYIGENLNSNDNVKNNIIFLAKIKTEGFFFKENYFHFILTS